jgi:hypothetical protein
VSGQQNVPHVLFVICHMQILVSWILFSVTELSEGTLLWGLGICLSLFGIQTACRRWMDGWSSMAYLVIAMESSQKRKQNTNLNVIVCLSFMQFLIFVCCMQIRSVDF